MDIKRGEIIGKRVGEQPTDEAEHFIRCPICNGWIDMRDLGQVLQHEGPFAAPWAGPDKLKHTRKSATGKTYRWAIYRLRGTPAAFVGTVDALDENDAIQAAIEQLGIDDPHQQKRLIAQRQA